MKNLYIIALSLTTSLSLSLQAEQFPICRSDLIKQMKRFEKTEFTVPRKIPSGNLRDYALKMEILCPWQIEADINGDKQLDWAGIIYRNNQFELVAYLSTNRKFQLQVLHTYQFFPEQSYLKLMRNNSDTRKKLKRYDLVEVAINDTSRVYRFKGATMKVSHSYTDETIIKSKREDETLNDSPKPYSITR